MAVMLSKTYDALIAAGAPEEIAGYDSRLARIETRLDSLTWVVGLMFAFMLAGFGAILTVLFQMTRQLGAISTHLGLP
jgi:hypothetical protein